jgi:tetratricopeptide (TPR) repeat protein
MKDRATQSLLVLEEARYPKDGPAEYHVEMATLVQSPEGLSALGNVTLPWQPDKADLIVNKVRILRAGKEIDLLAGGQGFTVLRRENNLEAAMLDGVLTATMQPEGLSVGDILDISFTLRSKPQALPFRPEDMTMLVDGLHIGRVHYRQMWEKGVDLRWAATPAIGQPKVTKTGWGTELLLDRTNVEAPEAPNGAPSRYALPARLEVTGYADWNSVSKLLAPAFAAATRIGPESPLKAEIARIAAQTADPKQRAQAALRLVEDKVRYFALVMGDGGYIPATADQTWARKFGDCKAKTVLLLALLEGLGIDAEPVLVSAFGGDLVGVRLPQVGAFDHVLVRAKVGGGVYWLDGTRSGDRTLEALASSPFPWGLPLRAEGAALESLPRMAPTAPLMESAVTFDASHGFFTPVPVTGRLIYRGDPAIMMRLALQQVGAEALKKGIAQTLPASAGDLQIDFLADDEKGTFTLTFKGTARMAWTGGPGGKQVTYRFDSHTIQWSPDFKRTGGAPPDVPFALEFPVYMDTTETILLPQGGAGFTLVGRSFDRIVAATRVARTISLTGGRASAHSLFVRLKPEVSAAEAHEAEAALKEVNADIAGVRSGSDYQMGESERQALLAREPTTAGDYNRRGYEFLQAGELGKALSDFDRAVALSPAWSVPAANRAIVFIHRGKLDEAKAALAQAAAIDPSDFIVHQARGLIAAQEGRPLEAVDEFTEVLRREPANGFTLKARAAAYEQLGKLHEALADIDRVLEADPKDESALWESARLHAGLGEADAALATNARVIALRPEDAGPVGNRGELLWRLGRKAEAMDSWGKAIVLIDRALKQPNPDASMLLRQKSSILSLRGDHKLAVAAANEGLRRFPGSVRFITERCRARAEGGFEIALGIKDCDEAIRYDKGYTDAFIARAVGKLRMEKWDEAIADASAALAMVPNLHDAYFVRAIARLRKGDRTGGEKDLAEARRLSFDIDGQYAPLGIAVPALPPAAPAERPPG